MEFWNRIYGLARPFRAMLVLSLAVTAAAQFVGFLPMLAQKWLFDLAEERYRGGGVPPAQFALAVAAIVLTATMSEIGSQIVWFLSDRLQMRMSQRLNASTSEHLLRLSLGFHTRHDTADKLAVLERGLNSSHEIVWTALVQLVPVCCLWTVYLGWTVTIAPVSAAVMATGSVVLILTATLMQGGVRPLRKAWRDADRAASTYIHDVMRNIRMVKSTATEPSVMERIVQSGLTLTEMSANVARRTMRLNSVQSVVRQATSGIVLSIAVWQMLSGHSTLGTLTLLYGVSQRLVMSAQSFLQYYNLIERHRPDAESLFRLLDERPDIVPPAHPVPLGAMLGSIAFERVSFAYPDTAGTIRDVTFFVPAGKTVAIVGKTGAGKSTLATLMLRGFDPHAGRVLVDGKDLRELDLKEFLRQVGIVIQGLGLFSLSVRDNIAFGVENVTPEQVERAARVAGAHEFIAALKDGYDTQVGEGGVRLSGGQAQRIALARALLRDPRLLVLDEATSQLDEETQAAVMSELVRCVHGTRTVVIIAHRLSTVRFADEIIVLDDGRVVEQGTFASLSSAGGPFQRFVETASV